MVVSLCGVRPEVDGELGLYPEEVGPFVGPVAGELFALEQGVNEGRALGRARIGEKVASFLGGGEGADGIEEGAAEKDSVAGGIGGLNAELFQASEDELVDAALGNGRAGALENER